MTHPLHRNPRRRIADVWTLDDQIAANNRSAVGEFWSAWHAAHRAARNAKLQARLEARRRAQG